MSETTATKQIVVEPYRVLGAWVVDCPSAGMVAQPFARGIPEILDLVLRRKDLTDILKFRLTFSDGPFPDWDGELDMVENEAGGPTYYLKGIEHEPSGRLFLLDAFRCFLPGAPPSCISASNGIVS